MTYQQRLRRFGVYGAVGMMASMLIILCGVGLGHLLQRWIPEWPDGTIWCVGGFLFYLSAMYMTLSFRCPNCRSWYAMRWRGAEQIDKGICGKCGFDLHAEIGSDVK